MDRIRVTAKETSIDELLQQMKRQNVVCHLENSN